MTAEHDPPVKTERMTDQELSDKWAAIKSSHPEAGQRINRPGKGESENQSPEHTGDPSGGPTNTPKPAMPSLSETAIAIVRRIKPLKRSEMTSMSTGLTVAEEERQKWIGDLRRKTEREVAQARAAIETGDLWEIAKHHPANVNQALEAYLGPLPDAVRSAAPVDALEMALARLAVRTRKRQQTPEEEDLESAVMIEDLQTIPADIAIWVLEYWWKSGDKSSNFFPKMAELWPLVEHWARRRKELM